MRQICIPFTDIADEKQAEVEVRVSDTGEIWRYRLEALPSQTINEEGILKAESIAALQQYINSYSNEWELIQIFDRNERTGNIHLLYREKAIQQSLKINSNQFINK
jgi:hypothetical protein